MLFFVSFLFLGVQMLLPLVLAIVVESYKEQQKDIVSKVRIHRPGMRTHTHTSSRVYRVLRVRAHAALAKRHNTEQSSRL